MYTCMYVGWKSEVTPLQVYFHSLWLSHKDITGEMFVSFTL